MATVDLGLPDGYTLGGALGEGGHAEVVEVRRERDGARLALKRPRRGDAVGVDALLREREALARLSVRGVPRLVAACTTRDGRPALVMTLGRGERLDRALDALRADARLTAARTVVARLLEILAEVHAAGFVHCDVKPSNVVAREVGGAAEVTLLDFGAASPIGREARRRRDGEVLGTPRTMAPEQCAGGAVDVRTDVYAVGAVLYEVLTGRPPFAGSAAQVQYAHLTQRPPRPSRVVAGAAPFDGIVARAMEKDPAARFPDARAMREALLAIALPAARASEADGTDGPTVTTTEATATEATATTPASEARREEVAVVWLALSTDVERLRAEVAARGAELAHLGRRHAVVVIAATSARDPARRAAELARALVDAELAGAARVDVRAVTHTGRDGGRRRWWSPAFLDDGVADDDRRAIAVGARAQALLARPHHDEPLVGREELLAELVADSALAFARGAATVSVVRARAGAGRSRLARALAEALSGGASAPLVVGPTTHAEEAERLVRAWLAAPARPLAWLVDDAEALPRARVELVEAVTELPAPAHAIVHLFVRDDGDRPRASDLARLAAVRVERTLPPLSPPEATRLARQLLADVDAVPQSLVAALAARAEGLPALIVELIASLRRGGLVRRRTRGEARYVATDLARVTLPPVPLVWAVTREVDALEPDLRALLELIALLGPATSRDELRRVIATLEAAGAGAWLRIDADVGVARLVARGLLVGDGAGARIAVRSELVREAIAAGVDARRRAEIHGAAADAITELPRKATHAAMAGRRDEAVRAWTTIAVEASARGALLDEESALGAALALLTGDHAEEGARRAALLVDRARTRHRLGRHEDALADLEEAGRAVERPGERVADAAIAVRVALERATVLDWLLDAPAAAAAVEQAVTLLERHQGALPPPRHAALSIALTVGKARAAFRESRWEEARRALGAIAAMTTLPPDEPVAEEAWIVAHLLLGTLEAEAHAIASSERTFARVIATCEARADRFHLAAALHNRASLWMARGEPARAVEDLRRSIALGRELGILNADYFAELDLAAAMLRMGRHDAALAHAQRAARIERRELGPGARPLARLREARIRLAAGEHATARAIVAELAAHQTEAAATGLRDALFEPNDRVMLRYLELATRDVDGHPRRDDDEAEWRRLLEAARALSLSDEREQIEAGHRARQTRAA